MKYGTIAMLALAIAYGLGRFASGQPQAQTQPAPGTVPGLAPGAAAVLLEKGIFTEETVGDLDTAITIYRQVVEQSQADRQHAAQAQYRLAMCYRKKKDEAKARTAFDALVKQFSDQTELIAQARKQFPNELRFAATPPWPDREEMRLALKTKTGMAIGMIIYTAQSVSVAEETQPRAKDQPSRFWRIESHMAIPISNTLQFTRVDAGMTSFAPTFGRTKNTILGDFIANYLAGKVNLEGRRRGEPSISKVDVAGPVYDNEQVLFLIRRLPLEVGYEAKFQIFAVQSGIVLDCTIKVVGKEKVACPAGEFETYKVILKVPNVGIEHRLWFSADERRWLVKYDANELEIELLGVGRMAQQAEPWQVAPGLTILKPVGWHYYLNPTPAPYKVSLHLLPPELKAWAVFMVAEKTMAMASTRQVADDDVEVLKGFFKDYTVRPNSWRESTIGSLSGVTYVADYRGDADEPMVEYRTYLLGDAGVYWFVFRIEKDHFDAERAEFDAIVNSFHVQQADQAQSTIPHVVRTTPATLANDVDPALDKLTVTFDRPMMDKSWSWTGGGDTYPKIVGDIAYDAGRTTCTMPVKLEPGKVYWVGINSPSHRNFKTPDRKPVRWYIILFATRDAQGKPTPLPDDMLARAKAINEAAPLEAPPAAPAGNAAGKTAKSGELAHDDGTSAGKQSFADAAQGVSFEAPGENARLTAVRVYGSRYGMPNPPAEDFRVWVTDAQYHKIAEFKFPYSTFVRSEPQWVELPVKPTAVPKQFTVFIDFNAERTKGVYVHYDAGPSGASERRYSLVAPRDGEVKPFEKGDWMIRVALQATANTADKKAVENLAAEGWRLWNQKKFAEAESKFQEAATKDPGDANVWNGLGWSQFNQGKPLNAKESFEKAVALDPKAAASWNGLGWIAKGQGKVDEAIGHWKKAVAAAPTATAALSGLAMTYVELGQYDKAIQSYEQWLKTEPDNADVKAGLQRAKEAAKAK